MTGNGFAVIAGRDPERRARLASGLEADPKWQRVPFEGPAEVFVAAGASHISHPEAAGAIVIGTVFHRRGPNASTGELDAATARNLRDGSAERLLAQYWGGFVALAHCGTGLLVIRDPSSAMSCLYASVPGGTVIGSDVAALMAAGLPRPGVSAELVGNILYRADLPSCETALRGIKELLPGTILRIKGDDLHLRQIWSPWDHCAIDETAKAQDHVERLARAVRNSATAWSSVFGRILLGVSGGLDSSIIAVCLARKLPPPLCITLATEDADGDERAYARALADHCGLTLIEAHYDLDDIDPDRSARPDLPRPTGRLIAQGYNAVIGRVVREDSSEAFFTGNGGDNVFAFSQSGAALADRLIHEGISAGAWRTAHDICRLTGCSLFEAARAALRILLRPHRYVWRPDRRFLNANVLAEFDANPLDHPWLDAPAHALPGKAAHIASLLRIQRHLDGTGQLGILPVINPLMAQPVVEACLAIPSWMWCQDGRNRSLARAAFHGALPPAIVERMSKGGPDGFGTKIVERWRGRITQRLLDGNLARHGLIDRQALEQRLGDDRPNWGADQVRLLELLEAEAWMDHWRAR